jgi:hypothetical protein
MNKTGSTTIQNLFYLYRDYFAKQGIYYPFTGTTRSHHNILDDFYPDPFWTISENYLESLESDVKTVNPGKCLISSEVFYYWIDKKEIAEAIKSIFRDYQIKIIVYIRRVDKWLPSVYKHRITRFQYSVLDKELRYVNHIEKLAAFKKAFGIDNSDIIIRPFEVQQFHQNDLLKDFLNIIDIKDPENVTGKMKPLNVKAHLNHDMIEYVRQMSVAVNHLGRKELSIWQKIMSDYPCPNEYDDVSLFGSYENLEETMNCYIRMYEHIAREYLGREDGRMFYEPPPDKSDFRPYPGLTPEKIAQINGYLHYKIRQECMNQLKAIKKWTFHNIIVKLFNRSKALLRKL